MTHLNDNIIERIGDVVSAALLNNEIGVVEWAERATADANMLGKLRDRDMNTLNRLEGIFSREFYRDNSGASPIYA